MSRLEKKCYLGSSAFHGLLLLVILLTAAFGPSNNTEPMTVVTLLPGAAAAAAAAAAGGVRSEVKPAPQPPEPPVRQPDPPPAPPDPPKHIEPKPKDPKPEVVKDPEKDHGPLPIRPRADKAKEPPKEKPALTSNKSSLTNLVKRVDRQALQLAQAQRDRQARQERADHEAQVQLAAQRKSAIAEAESAITGVSKGLSKSSVVSSSGIDTSGGAVSGHYGEGLKSIYESKWVLNADAYDDETAASVRVVVRRDGSVVSAILTKPSGHAAFDRSVRAALNEVKRVLPFPSEIKDAEREFTWKFERKTRVG